VTDSDSQRVEWLNSLLQKLWPYISLATEALAKQQLQPVLDAYRPVVLTKLEMEQLSLGTVAPKITGVRFFSSDEANIRMDLELKWASNCQVSMQLTCSSLSLLS
jgi:Ca2+-dependent lipid-binding protein